MRIDRFIHNITSKTERLFSHSGDKQVKRIAYCRRRSFEYMVNTSLFTKYWHKYRIIMFQIAIFMRNSKCIIESLLVQFNTIYNVDFWCILIWNSILLRNISKHISISCLLYEQYCMQSHIFLFFVYVFYVKYFSVHCVCINLRKARVIKQFISTLQNGEFPHWGQDSQSRWRLAES
jgi:hypothetical protein